MVNANEEAEKKFRYILARLPKNVEKWSSSHARSLDLLDSLLNLAEQLSACIEAKKDGVEMTGFQDLNKKLKYKIISSMESVMKELHVEMDSMESARNNISSCKSDAFKAYLRLEDVLTVQQAVTGSPTFPAVATFLEWLTDLERSYTNLFEYRSVLLQTIRYDDTSSLQTVIGQWKDQSCLRQVDDILQQIASFTAAT